MEDKNVNLLIETIKLDCVLASAIITWHLALRIGRKLASKI